MPEVRTPEGKEAFAGSEQRQILELLAAGQLDVKEAEGLLDALSTLPLGESRPAASVSAQLLRITVQTEDTVKVKVNVPLSLAKFAVQFLPKDARRELELQGIDLSALVDSLEDGFPEGRLVDVEAYSEERDEEVNIVIEVL